MAICVGIGLSTEKDLQQAARDAVRQARYSLNADKISLAIVFSSVFYAQPKMLSALCGLLGAVPLVGCSSLGILSHQGIFKNALAVMLLSLPPDIYAAAGHVQNIRSTSSIEAGERLAGNLSAAYKSDIRRDLCLIFSDGFIPDGSSFLYGLQEQLGTSLPLAGGAASGDLKHKKTFQYFDAELLTDAACGILWGGRMHFSLGVRHGWQPLGKPRTVTRAKGNIVYHIDGKPAVEYYEDYFKCDIPALRRELKRISVLYPIGIHLAGENEYLLRNILSIEDDGTLLFQGNVPEGCDIRLMIGTKESCLAAAGQVIDEAKKELYNNPIDFALIFDSISRNILLGREAYKETDIIKTRLGENIPFLGIYTCAEQSPLKALNYQGKSYFHNQSVSVIAVGAHVKKHG